MEDDINKIHLPKSSRNSELETISRVSFLPLFSPEKFILKPEILDNGIDFRIEIISNKNILGFGCNFQLKSSEVIEKNKDGSFSKSIETSNIEYLINNAQPAFYGFYSETNQKFYYEHLQDLIQELNENNPDWQKQKTHTIRFNKELDKNAVQEVFEITLQKGKLSRKIHTTLVENANRIKANEKILIDFDENVISDREIIEIIEKNGLFLNNQSRWKEVIALHNKTSSGLALSPLYNLTIGISYFYTGEYYRSLDFLRESKRKIEDLDIRLQGHLKFFYINIQNLLGIVSNEEFSNETQLLNNSGGVDYYIQLEEIIKLRLLMFDNSDFRSTEFETKIIEFLENKKVSKKLKNIAESYLVSYQGERFLCILPNYIAEKEFKEIEKFFTPISENFSRLIVNAGNLNSEFDVLFVSLKQNRFLLHFEVICKTLYKSFFKESLINSIGESVKDSYNYFKKVGHIDNLLFSMTVLLEFYKLTGQKEQENVIFEEFQTLYKVYDYPDTRRRIEYTKTEGTFVHKMLSKKEKHLKEAGDIRKLAEELEHMDRDEKIKLQKEYDNYSIHLFPIGFFKFPKSELNKMYDILGINDKNLKSHLVNSFFKKKIMPIINIYVDNISDEGLNGGNLSYSGFKSYKKMYEVRKAFYENDFYRIYL